VARLFFEAGHIVLCAFISPFAGDRQFVRSLFPEGRFFEVHVQASLETCVKRDPHGSYAKALKGQIPEFTGISSPYEPPVHPEFLVETDKQGPEEIVDRLIRILKEHHLLGGD
jgi:adenylylsulfate kinase-like enzyme